MSLCLFPSTAYLFYLCRNEYFPLHELLLHYLDGILSHILPSHGILFYMDAKFNYFMEALTGFPSKGNQILNIGDASYKSVWFLFVFGMSHSTHRLFFF